MITNMSTEAQSMNTSVSSTGRESKRLRATTTPTQDLTLPSTINQPEEKLTPTQAALLGVETFIVTLHPGLQPFLRELLGKVVKGYASYHYKNKKHWEMILESSYSYVPDLCKKIGRLLHPLEEIAESDNFKTLDIQKEAK